MDIFIIILGFTTTISSRPRELRCIHQKLQLSQAIRAQLVMFLVASLQR
jgi:hypothetical protein